MAIRRFVTLIVALALILANSPVVALAMRGAGGRIGLSRSGGGQVRPIPVPAMEFSIGSLSIYSGNSPRSHEFALPSAMTANLSDASPSRLAIASQQVIQKLKQLVGDLELGPVLTPEPASAASRTPAISAQVELPQRLEAFLIERSRNPDRALKNLRRRLEPESSGIPGDMERTQLTSRRQAIEAAHALFEGRTAALIESIIQTETELQPEGAPAADIEDFAAKLNILFDQSTAHDGHAVGTTVGGRARQWHARSPVLRAPHEGENDPVTLAGQHPFSGEEGFLSIPVLLGAFKVNS